MSGTVDASLEAGGSVPVNPPRENLVRAVMPGTQIRSSEDGTKTLFGHFARFGEWTEINSAWEGRFMERIAPGAFAKTIAENRNGMRVLFDHGHDPSIGNKPLGAIRSLEEDADGAAYEVDLFDAGYVRDLLPALEAGQLGASFRFKVMREDFNKKPERADHNPDGLPERTIVEAKVMEFGPVTFPAYDGATAGVRSLTDDYILAHLFADPERLERVLEARKPFFRTNIVLDPEKVARTVTKSQGFKPGDILAGLGLTDEQISEVRKRLADFAPSTEQAPAPATPAPERRDNRENRFKNREEYLSWLLTSAS